MREGWEIKKIDDICTIKGRIGYRGYTKGDLVGEGEGAITLSPSNIKDNKLFFDKCTYISWMKYEESPEIMIFEGDIIFCKTASIGKMALVEFLPEKATLNPQFVVLKQINCNNWFLYYYMNSVEFKDQIKNITGGTAVPTLSQKNLGNLNLPIPPLTEQKQIVAILDKAFAAIDQAKANIEKNIENAKELFQSKLNEIFSQKGDGWEEKSLGELGTLTSSKRIYKKEYVQHGVPFYRSKEIKELGNGKEISLELFISEDRYLEIKKRYGIPQKGDILLTAVGTIGEMYVVKENEPQFYFKDGNIMWLKNFNTLNTYYLKYALTCFVEQLKSMSQGSAYNALTIEKLKKYTISVPSIDVQNKLVSEMNAVKNSTLVLEKLYSIKLEELEELKKSILQKAFAGELTAKKVKV